jgi:hypothetical protein
MSDLSRMFVGQCTFSSRVPVTVNNAQEQLPNIFQTLWLEDPKEAVTPTIKVTIEDIIFGISQTLSLGLQVRFVTYIETSGGG